MCTNSTLLGQGSVYIGSASWDHCRQVFCDELWAYAAHDYVMIALPIKHICSNIFHNSESSQQQIHPRCSQLQILKSLRMAVEHSQISHAFILYMNKSVTKDCLPVKNTWKWVCLSVETTNAQLCLPARIQWRSQPSRHCWSKSCCRSGHNVFRLLTGLHASWLTVASKCRG